MSEKTVKKAEPEFFPYIIREFEDDDEPMVYQKNTSRNRA